MASSTGTRQRLAPAERQEQILDAASDLIAQRGFHGVSLDEIAAACGFSKHGVLYHFRSKENVLAAVLRRRDERDAASLGEVDVLSMGTAAGARAVLTRLVHRNLQQRPLLHLYATLGAEALAPGHPASSYFQERLRTTRTRLAQQGLAWHPAPELAAVELIAFLEGVQLQWLRDPSVDVVGQWELFADRFFVDPANPVT